MGTKEKRHKARVHEVDLTSEQEGLNEKGIANGEQRPQKQTNTILVGFFGGLFASILTYFAHMLNILPFGPGVIWQNISYYQGVKWLSGPWGHIGGIILISFLSILVAAVYYAMFRKIETPWLGIWFGFALWVVLFLGVNRMIPGTLSVNDLGLTTNVTFISIFILYGLFVGYSISYYYQSDHVEARGEKRT